MTTDQMRQAVFARHALMAVVRYWSGDLTGYKIEALDSDVSRSSVMVRVMNEIGGRKYGVNILFNHEPLIRDDQMYLKRVVQDAARSVHRSELTKDHDAS